MKRMFLLSIVLFVALTGYLNAQSTKTNTVRQVEQQSRIKEGVRSNELTRRETLRLEREQKKIQLEKRVAKADGTITPKEKRFLRREQNRASRHIAKQKNDVQERKF